VSTARRPLSAVGVRAYNNHRQHSALQKFSRNEHRPITNRIHRSSHYTHQRDRGTIPGTVDATNAVML
jgi:hypothetical protein